MRSGTQPGRGFDPGFEPKRPAKPIAHAEGIGAGWVPILDPAPLNRDLGVPEHWRFIGYFCIGYPAQVRDTLELEEARWEKRADAAPLIFRR